MSSYDLHIILWFFSDYPCYSEFFFPIRCIGRIVLEMKVLFCTYWWPKQNRLLYNAQVLLVVLPLLVLVWDFFLCWYFGFCYIAFRKDKWAMFCDWSNNCFLPAKDHLIVSVVLCCAFTLWSVFQQETRFNCVLNISLKE